MAQFPKIQLTQLGKNIILAGQNKQKVTFTKVELGDGLLDGQSVDDMTALVHSVMSLPLQNFLNNGDGSARLRFVLDNNNLAKGFLIVRLASLPKSMTVKNSFTLTLTRGILQTISRVRIARFRARSSTCILSSAMR